MKDTEWVASLSLVGLLLLLHGSGRPEDVEEMNGWQ